MNGVCCRMKHCGCHSGDIYSRNVLSRRHGYLERHNQSCLYIQHTGFAVARERDSVGSGNTRRVVATRLVTATGHWSARAGYQCRAGLTCPRSMLSRGRIIPQQSLFGSYHLASPSRAGADPTGLQFRPRLCFLGTGWQTARAGSSVWDRYGRQGQVGRYSTDSRCDVANDKFPFGAQGSCMLKITWCQGVQVQCLLGRGHPQRYV